MYKEINLPFWMQTRPETIDDYKLIYDLVHSNKITYVGKSDAQREYIHVLDASRISVEILNKK